MFGGYPDLIVCGIDGNMGTTEREHRAEKPKGESIMALAFLHSTDMDGTHTAPKQEVEILEQLPDGSYIVRTPAGVKCTAIFNIFTGCYFADDVYGVLDD